MKLAQIIDGTVVNVVEVDALNIPDFASTWPNASNAGPGWTYDAASGTFAPPDATPTTVTPAMVDAERDRRMHGTFTFQGKLYNCDRDSMARITGAATLAGFAIASGAPPGNLRWHGGVVDFVWIADDNSQTPMDAQTCFAFGQAAANNQSFHIFAARALKDTNPIPVNFAQDEYWTAP